MTIDLLPKIMLHELANYLLLDQIDVVIGDSISNVINAKKIKHFIGNNITDQMITYTQTIRYDT